MTTSRFGTTKAAWPLLRLAQLLLAVQLGLAGCGGDNLLLPSAGQPAKIAVVSGADQTGTVGQRLGEPIVVAVTDPEDRPVEGIEVAFVVPAGAEIAPNDTVVTGVDGRATVNYTLSTASGDQKVEARVKSVVPSSLLTTTFIAKAMPEAAVKLALAGGDGQRGEVSTALADSLAVRAVDQFGNGVAGVAVSWKADGGSVSAASVTTGADGRSAVERILADQPGTYKTTAAALGLDDSPVSFTATAVAAPSPALVLVTQPSSAASAGVPFAQQPELQLQDPFGAPLNQADVRVTVGIVGGEGSLGGSTSAQSDANGRVRFADLSIRGEPGTRTLIFATKGFSPAISSSIVVAPGPPSPEQSSASVPDGTAGAATSISIRLEDEFGTPVEGAAGSITVAVTGANAVSSLPVTDQGTGAYSTSYTPTQAGTDVVDVLVGGSRVHESPFTSNVVPGPASPATSEVAVTRTSLFGYDVLVTTKDAEGNSLGHGGEQVEVQVDGFPIPVRDNGDGTYYSNFLTLNPTPSVAVTLNDVPIAGSPFQP